MSLSTVTATKPATDGAPAPAVTNVSMTPQQPERENAVRAAPTASTAPAITAEQSQNSTVAPLAMHPALAAVLKGRKSILFPLADIRDANSMWSSAEDIENRLAKLRKECSDAFRHHPVPAEDKLGAMIEGAVAGALEQLQAFADATQSYEDRVKDISDPDKFARAVYRHIQRAGAAGTMNLPGGQDPISIQAGGGAKRAAPATESRAGSVSARERKRPRKRKDVVSEDGEREEPRLEVPVVQTPRSPAEKIKDEEPGAVPVVVPSTRTSIGPKKACELAVWFSDRGCRSDPLFSSAGSNETEITSAAASSSPDAARKKGNQAKDEDLEALMGHGSPAKGLPFSKEAVDILSTWFQEHLCVLNLPLFRDYTNFILSTRVREHPYATDDEKAELRQQTGLEIVQVALWLTNARRRKLPSIRASSVASDTSSARSSAEAGRSPSSKLRGGSSSQKVVEMPAAGSFETAPRPLTEIVTPTIEAAEAMLALGSDG